MLVLRAEDRANREQGSETVIMTGGVDVAQRAEHRAHRSRGQQIGRDHQEVADVVELPAMVGSAVATMVWSSAAGTSSATGSSGWCGPRQGQRRARRNRRRIANIEDLGGDARELAPISSGMSSVGRLAALPLVLVHQDVIFFYAAMGHRDGIAYRPYLNGQFSSRQHPGRMEHSRKAIAIP